MMKIKYIGLCIIILIYYILYLFFQIIHCWYLYVTLAKLTLALKLLLNINLLQITLIA